MFTIEVFMKKRDVVPFVAAGNCDGKIVVYEVTAKPDIFPCCVVPAVSFVSKPTVFVTLIRVDLEPAFSHLFEP